MAAQGLAGPALNQLRRQLARGDGIAGTGLGLYICKGLVEAHGGHIEALSPGPGKGATFAINIPLSQDAVPVPQPETPRKKGLDPLAQRLRELI